MRKGVREKTEVPVKILVNSTRETNILAREIFYKNVPWKVKSVREKTSLISENYTLIFNFIWVTK